ncbi:MAG: PQQ-binding-like beta-propeller repeat protein [Candidatus Sericytochromatia bacterium]|nr:PQQ-binding-like beta-propeller repeat protein [Candidatus Sericytochromatia bacterium]
MKIKTYAKLSAGLAATTLISVSCNSSAVNTPTTNLEPGATSSAAAVPVNPLPSTGGSQGVQTSPTGSESTEPGLSLPLGVNPSTCRPLATVSGPSGEIRGYLKISTSLSCVEGVKRIQYMYRLKPVGEFNMLGGAHTQADSSYEFNTSTLPDGEYEIVSKIELDNGDILMSAALTLTIANTQIVSVSGGGGGGTPTNTQPTNPDNNNNNPPPQGPEAPLTMPEGNVVVGAGKTFQVASGTPKFMLDFGGSASSSPLVDPNGNTFFVAGNQFLSFASNGAQSGSVSLSYTHEQGHTVSDFNVTAPAAMFVKDGQTLIYFGDNYGRIHVMDVTDPSNPVRKFNPPPRLDIAAYNDTLIDPNLASSILQVEYTAPALDCDGNMYMNSRDRRLLKLNLQTGEIDTVMDRLSVPGTFPAEQTRNTRYASPVIDVENNRVLTGSQYGFHVINTNNFNEKYSFVPTTACRSDGQCDYAAAPVDQAINSLLAFDNQGFAYVISEAGTVFKLDVSKLVQNQDPVVWSVFVGDGDNSPVIGTDGTIYVASEAGTLTAISPGGEILFRIGLSGVVEFASPVIGQGPDGEDIVYIGTENGMVYGFNGSHVAEGGVPFKQEFTRDVQGPIRNHLAMGPDGSLYASSLDGRVHAMYSKSTGLSSTAQWAKTQKDAYGSGRIGSCP